MMEDATHDLDMVAVFSSASHDGEMEALTIKGILDGSGIPAIVVGPSTIPSLDFQVQVPESRAEEAREVIAEARQAGPKAAMEAELEQEIADQRVPE
jgi:hypothetical protein